MAAKPIFVSESTSAGLANVTFVLALRLSYCVAPRQRRRQTQSSAREGQSLAWRRAFPSYPICLAIQTKPVCATTRELVTANGSRLITRQVGRCTHFARRHQIRRGW